MFRHPTRSPRLGSNLLLSRLCQADKPSRYLSLCIPFAVYLMADFNERIGRKRSQHEHWLCKFGDTTTDRNSNEEDLINPCLENYPWITNTFYQHRQGQLKTWYKQDRLHQRSQYNYIIVRGRKKRNNTDARVIPNANRDTEPPIWFMNWKNDQNRFSAVNSPS